MAMFYPRKQVWFILLISIVAVGLTAFYVLGSQKSVEKDVSGPKIAAKTSLDQAPVSNEDWKEQFIDNFASSSFKTSSASVTKTPEPTETLTSTQTIGRQLFAQILQLQSLGTTDEETLSKLGDVLAQNGLNSLRPATTYTLSSINVLKNPSETDLKKYSDKLIQILNAYIPSKENNEAVLTMQALQLEDFSLLSKLDPVISGYRSALKELSTIPIPEVIAYYHLELMNGISMALNNAEAFRNLETDPIKGMAAVSNTVESLDKISNAYDYISAYITSHKNIN